MDKDTTNDATSTVPDTDKVAGTTSDKETMPTSTESAAESAVADTNADTTESTAPVETKTPPADTDPTPAPNTDDAKATEVVVPQALIDQWQAASRPNFATDQSNMTWDTVALATFMNHPTPSGQADSVSVAKNGDQLPNGDLVIVSKYHVPFGFANLALNFGIGMNVIRYYNGIPNKAATKFDVRPGRKIVIPAGTVYVPEGK